MKDWIFGSAILFLVVISLTILTSVSKSLFPLYFVYVIFGIFFFWFFSQIGFVAVSAFRNHLYIFSIILLVITLIIGQVTRGTIRWIPVGGLSFQPAEIVRPFILVFFANLLTSKELKFGGFVKSIILSGIPIILILIQPSLGVAILTMIGFLGVLLSADFNKKYIFVGVLTILALVPLFWFVLQPYQKARVTSFINPTNDPLGSGYNSIQSMIAVGAGEFFGKGLGKGSQTQLAFLPERQTDFIFASVSEEMGFVGAFFLILGSFVVLWRLTVFMENSVGPAGRAYLAGFFLTYLAQVTIHIGMNIGLLPITGLPFPLVSAGGSSFIATMLGLGIAVGAYKR